MRDTWQLRIGRRLALTRMVGLAGGLATGIALGSPRTAGAQPAQWTASGGGVNVKHMPSPDGGTVPLRESFGFDPYYAQCIVEDNPEAFAMDTATMGRVVINAHQFFMAMHSFRANLDSVRLDAAGRPVARLVGILGCGTYAEGYGFEGVGFRIGSRTVQESANFEIVAVDGGPGGGAVGDSFAFTVFFDPARLDFRHFGSGAAMS
jgi:hypothetical protein